LWTSGLELNVTQVHINCHFQQKQKDIVSSNYEELALYTCWAN